MGSPSSPPTRMSRWAALEDCPSALRRDQVRVARFLGPRWVDVLGPRRPAPLQDLPGDQGLRPRSRRRNHRPGNERVRHAVCCARSSPATSSSSAGYAANSDILLAVERGEADAYSALATTIQLAVDRGAVRPLVRSRTPVPGWNHLPTDESLASSDIGRSLMAIRGIPLSIGRAFAVRPGTPADRVAMLRDALAKTITDPQLQAEAQKARIQMAHISADDVTKWFGDLLNQPPQVLEAMNQYLKVM